MNTTDACLPPNYARGTVDPALHVCQTNMGGGMKSALRLANCLGLLLALSSCSHRSESELETIALSLAVDEAKRVGPPHLWPRDRFPLTVGFFVGASLDSTGCVRSWRREFESYVSFMNGGRLPLLRLSSPEETEFDAMVYYGSFEEFESSHAYRLFRTWEAKPGIKEIWASKDNPYTSSATATLGWDPVARFSIRYESLRPGSVEARGGCSTTAQPSADLGKALMHVMPSAIRIQIERRYPGLERQVGWRAERRLFRAAQSMPSKKVERDEKKAAMVKALLAE